MGAGFFCVFLNDTRIKNVHYCIWCASFLFFLSSSFSLPPPFFSVCVCVCVLQLVAQMRDYLHQMHRRIVKDNDPKAGSS